MSKSLPVFFYERLFSLRLNPIFKLVVYTFIIYYCGMTMLLSRKRNVTVTSLLAISLYLPYGYTQGPPTVRDNVLCVHLNASCRALNVMAGLDTPVQTQCRIFERLLTET